VVSSSEQGVGSQPITVEMKRRDRLAAHKTRRSCMQDTQECACPQPLDKQWNVQRGSLRGSACLLEWLLTSQGSNSSRRVVRGFSYGLTRVSTGKAKMC
jgi:hypothetical protein